MSNMYRVLTTLCFLCSVAFNANAQDIAILKFEENPTNLTARTKPKQDKSGNECAVIRFAVQDDDFKIEGNLGVVATVKQTSMMLVYVPEGTKPDYIADSDVFDSTDQVADDIVSDRLIDDYTEAVMKLDRFITVKKFVSGQKDRDTVLSDFASGKLQVLTSMKCLDEGVDVPRSELAVFCASTGNPRQFIQRRGRILRTHPDKHNAIIHDLVVAPIINSDQNNYNMERNLIKNELQRVRDFAKLSENADYAYNELKDILSFYNLSLF